MRLQINDIIIEVEETENHYIYDGELDRAIFDNTDKIGFIYGTMGVERYGLELETFIVEDGKTKFGFRDKNDVLESVEVSDLPVMEFIQPTFSPPKHLDNEPATIVAIEFKEETNHGTAPEPETNLNLSSGNENESDTSNITDSAGK